MITPINLWESYRNSVYKLNVPLVKSQERECSRAFYAGMHAAFEQMATLADSVSDEELAAERLEDFRQSVIDAARATIL